MNKTKARNGRVIKDHRTRSPATLIAFKAFHKANSQKRLTADIAHSE
jgi:hypothetical protein